MNINNNFTPLAWHKGDIELQSNRASYAFGHIVPLIASKNTLIPFQLITEIGEIDVSASDVRLHTIDGTDAVGENLWNRMGMYLVSNKYGRDVLIFRGTEITPALPIGQYYFTLASTVNNVTTTWYSDVVTIVPDVAKMTRVRWYNVFDLVFGEGFIIHRWSSRGETYTYQNWMYFMEELGMPEYTVEEEGDTRDGLFYASKIVSGKKYKMQIAQLSEPMCDALRFVHLSDFVDIRDGYLRTYNCDNVLITPEWQDGAVASASVEITTDTFVKRVGNAMSANVPVIGQTGIIGEAVIGSTFTIGA